MIQFLIFSSLLNFNSNDSLIKTPAPLKKSYTKQVVVNTILGIGFGGGAAVFYTLGNKAYEDYKESRTIKSTMDNWNKVILYDNIRNLCVAGAVIFISRAVYYQLKQVKSSMSTGFVPVIDLPYTNNYKWTAGIKKSL